MFVVCFPCMLGTEGSGGQTALNKRWIHSQCTPLFQEIFCSSEHQLQYHEKTFVKPPVARLLHSELHKKNFPAMVKLCVMEPGLDAGANSMAPHPQCPVSWQEKWYLSRDPSIAVTCVWAGVCGNSSTCNNDDGLDRHPQKRKGNQLFYPQEATASASGTLFSNFQEGNLTVDVPASHCIWVSVRRAFLPVRSC